MNKAEHEQMGMIIDLLKIVKERDEEIKFLEGQIEKIKPFVKACNEAFGTNLTIGK